MLPLKLHKWVKAKYNICYFISRCHFLKILAINNDNNKSYFSQYFIRGL